MRSDPIVNARAAESTARVNHALTFPRHMGPAGAFLFFFFFPFLLRPRHSQRPSASSQRAGGDVRGGDDRTRPIRRPRCPSVGAEATSSVGPGQRTRATEESDRRSVNHQEGGFEPRGCQRAWLLRATGGHRLVSVRTTGESSRGNPKSSSRGGRPPFMFAPVHVVAREHAAVRTCASTTQISLRCCLAHRQRCNGVVFPLCYV